MPMEEEDPDRGGKDFFRVLQKIIAVKFWVSLMEY